MTGMPFGVMTTAMRTELTSRTVRRTPRIAGRGSSVLPRLAHRAAARCAAMNAAEKPRFEQRLCRRNRILGGGIGGGRRGPLRINQATRLAGQDPVDQESIALHRHRAH